MISYTKEDGHVFMPSGSDFDGMSVESAAEILEACVLDNDELKGIKPLSDRQYESIARTLYPEIEEMVREKEREAAAKGAKSSWWDAAELYLADAINGDRTRGLIMEQQPWIQPVGFQTKIDIFDHFDENRYKGARYEPVSVCRASNSKDDRDLYLVCCRAAGNDPAGEGNGDDRHDYATWVWNEAERKAYFGRYGLSEEECLCLMDDRFSDIADRPGTPEESSGFRWGSTLAEFGEGFRDNFIKYKETQAIEGRRKAFMAAYERTYLADNYRIEDTIMELVNAIGADGAQMAIAELVDTVHVTDGRISKRNREWANSIITPGVTAAHGVYNSPFVHPAKIDEYVDAMRDYMIAKADAMDGKDNEAQAAAEQPARRKGR